MLVSPGDVVLVELPTFTGAIAAFRNMQADLVGVKLDDDGISLEHLDHVWQQAVRAGKAVNLLYLVPNFQNPTGSLLGLDKRLRVLEWAERRDILIVEDDPYGQLYFEDVATEAETRPIAADDRTGRVLYLSTVSKVLAPGFRVGWMKAPEALIERFDTAKQSADLTSGILDQHIVHEALRAGVPDHLAPRLRDLYRKKRDVMAPGSALRPRLSSDVADTQRRLLPLGHAARGLHRCGVTGTGASARSGVRDRKRLPRRRQRAQHDQTVVLCAIFGADRGRRAPASEGLRRLRLYRTGPWPSGPWRLGVARAPD